MRTSTTWSRSGSFDTHYVKLPVGGDGEARDRLSLLGDNKVPQHVEGVAIRVHGHDA